MQKALSFLDLGYTIPCTLKGVSFNGQGVEAHLFSGKYIFF